jgi:hypothetical protein
MNPAAKFAGGLAEPLAVARVIVLAKEDGLPIVPTLNEMYRLIFKKIAARPSH